MNEVIAHRSGLKYVYRDKVVQVIDLRVPEPGVPEIGSLTIDGKNIFRKVNYAPTILFHDQYLFIPMARQKQKPISFSLCAIDLDRFTISVNPAMFPQIIPLEIKKNWIFFSTSVENIRPESMSLFWVL